MGWVIFCICVWLVWREYRKRHPARCDDGLGDVVGEATEYDECPHCGQADSQNPRGRGEVITRGGHYVVRQYHVCQNCNSRALWHRRIDSFVWTVNRSGVCGVSYYSHG